MGREDEIKNDIRRLVIEYCSIVHNGPKGEFRPGTDRVPYAARVFDSEEVENLVDSALEFWLTYGRYSAAFERELAQYIGVRFAATVNSGSSANLLAFMTLTSPQLGEDRIQRGDEVITVAAGFPTTIAPAICFGAIPVFVDVSLPTYNIDVLQLEAALSPRTKAVMIAHTLGNPFNLSAVESFCQAHNLWLIEDNCDALGSSFDGRLTGSWGDLATSSFYPAHHITTGEGGAVYTGNGTLKKIMLSLRDWGRDCWCDSGKDNTCGKRFAWQLGTLPLGFDHKYIYSHFGFNLKMTDMQAAIGLAQLKKLPDFVKKRRANFHSLLEGITDLEEFFILPEATPNSVPSWFGFILTLREGAPFKRHDLVDFLEKRKIQTRNLFAGNFIRHPCFDTLKRGIDYRVIGELPCSDKIMHDTFWLGVYPGLEHNQIDFMIQSLRDFVKGVRPSAL